MEKTKSGEKRRFLIGISAILGGSALFLTCASISANNADPEVAYTSEYTGGGDCLDGTPYDPDSGAFVNVNTVKGPDVLSVTPRDANFRTPSVLFFTINERGALSRPDLAAADYATGSFLVNANCPGQPNGY